MCRHLAYLGPPAAVGNLLTRGPHSLRTQSWAPREMRGGGTINADGFGVAWWHSPDASSPDRGPGVRWHGGPTADPVTGVVPGDGDDVAAKDAISGTDNRVAREATSGFGPRAAPPLLVSRYRNAAPIWTDPAVDEVLPQLHSTAVLAAIRSATVGMPVERAACAPFTHGRWAFSHNGAIPDWRRVLTAVAAQFGSPSLLEAESLTDSAALWVILRGLLTDGQSPGGVAEQATPADDGAAQSFSSASSVAFGASASAISGSAPRVTAWSRTSVTGGAHVSGSGGAAAGGGRPPEVALRLVTAAVLAEEPGARLNLLLGDGETIWATTRHHSLAVLAGEGFVVVASEPYDDDPRWRAIAEGQLVVARVGRLSVEPLENRSGKAFS